MKSTAAEWKDHIEDMRARANVPVTVAVLDSGIDGSHPDLRGRVKQALSVDWNGQTAEVHENDPLQDNDRFGHGTSVASIITKICPMAQVVDVRVLQANNSGVVEALVAALELVVDRGWEVANMSLAAEQSARPRLIDICERAYLRSQIVVAARRNLPFGDDGFPAELSACIGVDGVRSSFLERVFCTSGEVIEFGAMGENVVAARKGGGLTTATGSSFATPIISGLCALMLSAHGRLRPYEVKAALKYASGLP
jgi:subtilisin family serine protease